MDLLFTVYIGLWQMWIRMVSYERMSSFWLCTWWTWLKRVDRCHSLFLKTWYLPLSGNTHEDRPIYWIHSAVMYNNIHSLFLLQRRNQVQ